MWLSNVDDHKKHYISLRGVGFTRRVLYEPEAKKLYNLRDISPRPKPFAFGLLCRGFYYSIAEHPVPGRVGKNRLYCELRRGCCN
jgi:hypothetical protein